MYKRLLSVLLTFVLCVCLLAACGETATPATTVPTHATPPVTTAPTQTTVPITTAPTQATEEATDGIHPLLYKVTDDSDNVIWLFGSIHVGMDYFYPLPTYVQEAFDGSDALAVEADIIAFENDASAQVSILAPMVYNDGTTIKDHISQETYDGAVKIMQDSGIYTPLLDYYKPVIWFSFVETCAVMQCGYDDSLGIDRHLLQSAMDTGKEILEVESVEFQYNMLAGFSPELQTYLLDSSVANCSDVAEYKQGLDTMVSLWESGDENAFSDYLNAGDPALDPQEVALNEEYNKAMLVDRNNSMTQYAVQALESGKEVFICVGAAHVVGEGAMAQQLRELGYTVELAG